MDETFYEALGARLREARERAGLTQSRLERDAGVAPGLVGQAERGDLENMTAHDFRAIARVLGIDPGELCP